MVDTDPHASKAQLDDPHDNPKYDTNSDGTVDAVDSTAVDHDQTANRTHQGDDISPASVQTVGQNDIVINVPSDEPTFFDAITAASEYTEPRFGTNIIINIEAGTALSTGSGLIADRNLSHVHITSDDATVPVDANMPAGENFLWGRRSNLPVLKTKINMQGNGGNGIRTKNCRVYVDENADAGVINAADRGLYGTNSLVWAIDSDFSGAANRGVQLTASSNGHLQNTDASGAGGTGLFVSRGSAAAAEGMDLTNSGTNAAQVKRSIVDLSAADVSNPADRGLWANSASIVHAEELVGGGGSIAVIEANRSSIVDANLADINGGTVGIEVKLGSKVNATNATIKNLDKGVRVVSGEITMRLATISGNTNNAIRVTKSGEVVAESATLENSGDRALRADNAATVNLANATVDGTNGGDDRITFLNGGRLYANGLSLKNISTNPALEILGGTIASTAGATVDESAITTADTNPSTFNSVTSDGIIFN